MYLLQPARVDNFFEKFSGSRLYGITEHLRRRPFLEHATLFKEDNQIRHFPSELHLVCRENHGHTIRCQVADDVKHFGHKLGVERRSDFIQKHGLGSHRNSTDNRDPLLLTTRELIRIIFGAMRQIHPI